ncbi:hypothetical protein ISF_01651 [Cordyceps fumosorosea ARSEF 2679]|uniref:Tat pathway signal sequence n=1 Tax=Cordyceps fumosorosea (strain ARSEF 2679) TaxID=1081104 RepID=A0A168DG90_CORFA|nr:hypothetical protein ISF_01651 [Cordyceps fumosorosea ARSEF 2679]OAA72578.1 hypothetical protein ISF_01651 [Cordyceps fumosorosea ARSEF 2679]
MSLSFDKERSARASSESLIQHHERPQDRRRRSWSIRKAALVTVGVLVGSLELIVLETILVRWGEGNNCSQGPLLSELNNLVPRFSTIPVLFREDKLATVKDMSERSRNETHDNWLSYMPKGNGFIGVNNSETYQLPDPISFLGHDVYSMAVFHQLHCLYQIMDRYNALSGGSPEAHGHAHPGRSEEPDDGGQEQDQSSHRHINHCFRYLRQSLLCCGDTALEGQDPNTNTTATDGTGAVHMCKDFEALRSWAEKNRLVNNQAGL